jgi:hypothetical protein
MPQEWSKSTAWIQQEQISAVPGETLSLESEGLLEQNQGAEYNLFPHITGINEPLI